MPTLRTVSLALRIASAQLLTLYYPLPQPRREVTPAALRKLVCEVSSCVVHFDGFRLSSSFLLPLAINVISRENCPVAAKHGCPTPVAPGGDPYTRWLRLPSPYYAPSACSKMPWSILLVFDLDGVGIFQECTLVNFHCLTCCWGELTGGRLATPTTWPLQSGQALDVYYSGSNDPKDGIYDPGYAHHLPAQERTRVIDCVRLAD